MGGYWQFYCQGELILQWFDWDKFFREVHGDVIGLFSECYDRPLPQKLMINALDWCVILDIHCSLCTSVKAQRIYIPVCTFKPV